MIVQWHHRSGAKRSLDFRCTWQVLFTLMLASQLGACVHFVPGSDGDPSVVTEAEVEQEHANFFTASYPDITPVCGDTYAASARVERRTAANCQNPGLQALYNRAVAHVDAKIARTQCPAECRPKATWISAQGWRCDPENGYSISGASVEKSYMCPRLGVDTPPAGEQAPGPNDFGQSRPVLHTVDITETGYPGVLTCATRKLYKLEHSETVSSCFLLLYDPIIRRAEDEARRVHGSLSCAAQCSKLPYQAVYRAWGCSAPPPGPGRSNTATVEIYFRLDCPI